MKNEEILKENNGKKFDIILSNPPYQQRHNDNPIHFQFVEKCFEIGYNQITIMPSRILETTSKNYDIWKEKLSKYLINAEELSSTIFESTAMAPVAIYVFNKNKKENTQIKISLLDKERLSKTEYSVKSLLETTRHNEYEENILNVLDNKGNITLINLKTAIPKSATKEKIIEDKLRLTNRIKDKYKGKYLLSVNIANGGLNGTYMSSQCGLIFNNFDDILKNWIDRNVGAIKYVVFDNKLFAERVRDAMRRPLLRFALYRTQDDQNMNNKCYRYVPDIDWSDDRVKTDEGLLEVCGCPKDKCKEYADYCKKIIDKVDKK